MAVSAFVEGILDGIDTLVAWSTKALKQNNESYCDLQTADSETVFVAHDGSLGSMIKQDGSKALVGREEFDFILNGFMYINISKKMTNICNC